MKGTDNFKKVIKDYLDKYAIEDPFFEENYKKENKNSIYNGKIINLINNNILKFKNICQKKVKQSKILIH